VRLNDPHDNYDSPRLGRPITGFPQDNIGKEINTKKIFLFLKKLVL
jgi:hypothetical protein